MMDRAEQLRQHRRWREARGRLSRQAPDVLAPSTHVPDIATPGPPSPMQAGALAWPMTFESFVPDDGNAAALACVRGLVSGVLSVPVLNIIGASGLGKTHLLRAAWAEIWRVGPALYVNAYAAGQAELSALRAPETLRALMVDDIMQLRPGMAAEVSRAVCALSDLGRPVLISGETADAPALMGLVAGARIASGRRVGLAALGPDACRCLVERWCDIAPAARGLTFGDDVRAFVLRQSADNGRSITQTLGTIASAARLRGEPISLDLARDAATVCRPRPTRILVGTVMGVVERHFRVSRADILSQRRCVDLVWPRHVGMYLAKEITPRSLPEIGRAFGGRDHTTVLHACRKVARMAEEDPAVAVVLKHLEQLILEEAAR